jgi:predicted RNase H-like nuclease
MAMTRPQRGAQLPYRTLAGVVPFARGWLAATAKLQGITMSPEEPQVFSTLLDVLDYKPAFQVISLFAPVGLLDEPTRGGRRCERDARRLLGRPRSSAIISAPIRRAVTSVTFEEASEANGGHLSAVSWRQMSKIAEVDAHIAPYWQRTVFEVHPELSLFQLNDDRGVRYSKHTRAGMQERIELLAARFPGVERVLDAKIAGIKRPQLIDAALCLWTARRIISRSISRLPEDPEWDALGLRMEIIR